LDDQDKAIGGRGGDANPKKSGGPIQNGDKLIKYQRGRIVTSAVAGPSAKASTKQQMGGEEKSKQNQRGGETEPWPRG